MTEPKPNYDAYLERQRRHMATQRATGRDLEIAVPEDIDRRLRCRTSFRRFCETYHASTFCKAWSQDHLEIIDTAEDCVFNDRDFGLAADRGKGKSSLMRALAEWVILYRHRRFAMIFGATGGAAKQHIDNVKYQLGYNEALAADFPDVCGPIRALKGSSRRCDTQTIAGDLSRIKWGVDFVRLALFDPTTVWPEDVAAALAGTLPAGACVRCISIDSNEIRGTNIEDQRPDFLIYDDIESRDSVKSAMQTEDRHVKIENDCAGLAGQGEQMTQFFIGTIMAEGTLTDQYTDPRQKPSWNGRRYRFLIDEPDNGDLWDEYITIRSDAENAGRDAANTFYGAHRAEMDAGARVSWAESYNPQKGQLSALQNYYDQLADKGLMFVACELQNDPGMVEANEPDVLTREEVCNKINTLQRGTVPESCTRLTAFIDVHKHELYWIVVGWDEAFSGWICDYGRYPKQHNQTLADLYPKHRMEGAIRAALEHVEIDLCENRTYTRADATTLEIERGFADSGWEPETVYGWTRECRHKTVWFPSKGWAARAGQEWREGNKTGFVHGEHWRVGPPPNAGANVRLCTYDANYWKRFAHRRFKTPRGEGGCMTLFGTKPDQHRLFADHMVSERALTIHHIYGSQEVWQKRQPSLENHWLDCVTGATVAASSLGLKLKESTPATAKRGSKRARAKVTHYEV